jgi:hypothetical protein
MSFKLVKIRPSGQRRTKADKGTHAGLKMFDKMDWTPGRSAAQALVMQSKTAKDQRRNC